MKLIAVIALFALTGISVVCRGQYSGGVADGGSSGLLNAGICTASANANIFFGGGSDGSNAAILMVSACAAATNANIYFGGIEDGHSSKALVASACPAPQNSNIFFGGIRDGFSYGQLSASVCPVPQNGNVFFGGIEDGFSSGLLSVSVCPPPPNINIYLGGVQDGFSTVFFKELVDPCVLSLRLLSFTGSCSGQVKELMWYSAGGDAGERYYPEYSPDGSNWVIIGTVQGTGGQSAIQSYSFADAAQRSGQCYYRIQQISIGGNYSFSPVLVIGNCGDDPAERLTIYPNPSFGVFNLSFDGDPTKCSSIEIYNVLEELVFRTGSYQSKIDLTDRATGTYFVHFTADGKTQIRKIVIRR